MSKGKLCNHKKNNRRKIGMERGIAFLIMILWKTFVLLCFCSLSLLSGCSKSSRDKSAEDDPLFEKGRRLADSRDFEGAIQIYKQALHENPKAAKPHLELALIYDEEMQE